MIEKHDDYRPMNARTSYNGSVQSQMQITESLEESVAQNYYAANRILTTLNETIESLRHGRAGKLANGDEQKEALTGTLTKSAITRENLTLIESRLQELNNILFGGK